MAVTIDNMQVQTQDGASQKDTSAGTPEHSEPMNFRREKEALAERELRLKAD